jgi:hypothetical protein
MLTPRHPTEKRGASTYNKGRTEDTHYYASHKHGEGEEAKRKAIHNVTPVAGMVTFANASVRV